jgi:CRP-like cAMP-binding protein
VLIRDRLVQRLYPGRSAFKASSKALLCASGPFAIWKSSYSESDQSRRWPGDIVAKQPASAKILFDPLVFLRTEGEGRTIAKYQKIQQVFSQDSSSDSVFYVIKGKVKIVVLSEQGKEAVIAIVGPDEFFGEGCLTGQVRRLSTASAMTECEIMRISKPTIDVGRFA